MDSTILLSSSGPWIYSGGSHSESHLPITLWKLRCEGLWSQRVENILLHLVSVSLPSITTLPLREFPFQSVLFRLLLTHLTHSLPFPAYVEEKKLQILLQGENSEISAWSGPGPGHSSKHSYLTYLPLLEGLVTALHPPSLSFYHKDQTV